MLNLLPPQQKKELRMEFLDQLIISAGIAIIFTILILALLLLVAQSFLNMSLEELNRELNLWQSKPEIKELQSLEVKAKELNKNLVFLDRAYKDQVRFSQVLEDLIIDVPAGIQFNSLVIQGNKISINGYATTRDVLLAFKGTLEGATYVSDFDFPLSNLTKITDINFSLNFAYAE